MSIRHAVIRRSRLVLLATGAAAIATLAGAALAQSQLTDPVELANPLMGTAPLDNQKLIGNAPPPGEPVYNGQTTPAARLWPRHDRVPLTG